MSPEEKSVAKGSEQPPVVRGYHSVNDWRSLLCRIVLTAFALLTGLMLTGLWITAMAPHSSYWWIGAIVLAMGTLVGIAAVWLFW